MDPRAGIGGIGVWCLWVWFVVGCREAPRLAPPSLSPQPVTLDVEHVLQPEIVGAVEVVAVGDVLMHSAVKAAAVDANVANASGESINHGGFGALFDGVRPLIESADHPGPR